MKTSMINKAVSGLVSKLPAKKAQVQKTISSPIIYYGNNAAQREMVQKMNVAIDAINHSDTFISSNPNTKEGLAKILSDMIFLPKQ